MSKVSKYFFYLTLCLSINLYSQECDVICELEKLKSKKIDTPSTSKRLSTTQSPNNYYTDFNKPLINDKNELLGWINDIVEFYGTPLVVSIGSVQGDLNSFSIRNVNFNDSLDDKRIASINRIEADDLTMHNIINKRLTLEEILNITEFNYENYFSREVLDYSDSTFKINGLSILIPDDELDIPIEFQKLNLLRNHDYEFKTQTKFGNSNQSFLMNFNDQISFKFEADIVLPSYEELKETHLLFIKTFQDSSEYCQINFDDFNDYYGLDLNYPIYLLQTLDCLFYNSDFDGLGLSISSIANNAFYNNLSQGKYSYDISWSYEFWNSLLISSGGTIDAALLGIKPLLAKKMTMFEFNALLDGSGLIPYEYKGLANAFLYELYSDLYNELKKFINNPRGIRLTLEVLNPIDPAVLSRIEDNPMLIFNILNNIKFSIEANPGI